MASNLTPFYGLSQWEGTDKFSRTDFNEDNYKVDTALANMNMKIQANPFELVTYYKAEYTVSTASLSLENIDLSKYLRLILFVDIMPGNYSEGFYYLRLNNISTASYYRLGAQEPRNYLMRARVASGYSKNRIVQFSPYEEGAYVYCFYESFDGDEMGMFASGTDAVTWENIKSIDYSASSTGSAMKADSGIYLYGIKKP